MLLGLLLPTLATAQQPFVTTWKTDNPGTSGHLSIRVPTLGGGTTTTWTGTTTARMTRPA
ncbi:MAG: hypothetical protein IPM82_20455 [Saprospiraceae bacterium]|nr:hypothetical protein [Saprospiraceae bacterium]